MPDDAVPLLIGFALIGIGLYLNRSAFRRRAAQRRAQRVDRRVEDLCDGGHVESALTLLDHEVGRLRIRLRKAASDVDSLRLAGLLQLCAQHCHLIGDLDAALSHAQESVSIVNGLADRYPTHVVWPNVALGRVLAGLGHDEAAVQALRRAYLHVRADTASDPQSDEDRVVVGANLSMVLRRTAAVDEAIEIAQWAIAVGESIAPGALPHFTRAAVGWAYEALERVSRMGETASAGS